MFGFYNDIFFQYLFVYAGEHLGTFKVSWTLAVWVGHLWLEFCVCFCVYSIATVMILRIAKMSKGINSLLTAHSFVGDILNQLL